MSTDTHSLRLQVAGEVRAEMARQKKTGRELGDVLGLTAMSASRRLSGQTSIDLDELSKIADWLGVPVHAFFPERVA